MATTNLQLGPLGTGVASANIAANTCVKWHTVAGQIANCGVGDIPIGITQDAIVSGKTGSFYRWGAGYEYLVNTTGDPAAGDYLKCGASGVLVAETSATTPTLYTVGQAKTAADSGDQLTVTAMR